MLNAIWAAMIFIGILFGTVNGNLKEITEAALQSAGEGVSLCITMAGIVAFWMGLMEIAEQSGLIDRLTRLLSPFVSFMFPKIPKGHKARDYISTNIIANVLGLGWACTPAGLMAMEELARLEEERGTPGYAAISGGNGTGKGRSAGKAGRPAEAAGERIASNEMCTFLILNISSLQLIPVNMIAYRQQYGSVNPAGIIAPAIAATCFSTLAAVAYCKVKHKARRK